MQEHKQTTEAEFFQRGGDVTYACDLSGNFTFLSEDGARISGYSCEEACQMNIADLLDSEIAGRFHEQIVSDMTKHVGAVYEIDLIARDGRSVPVEVSTRVVLRDGRPIEIQGIAVPSLIRGRSPKPVKTRWLNEAFLLGGSPITSEIMVRII
jgi:PAS domain S-box-containing protein